MKSVVLITGASSGLGWSMAKIFAADGWSVGLLGRRRELLEKLSQEISERNGKSLILVCDVTNRAAVKAAVEECEKQYGPIDCLVANAGVGGPTPPWSFDAAIAENCIRTNLLGPIYCLEAVLPGMVARKSGQIVAISSLASYRGLPETGVYCATKSGLNALFESLRISLRKLNVSVTIICPGFIRTPMTANNKNPMPFLIEQDDAAARMYQAIIKKKKWFAFPWQLVTAMRIARILPAGLYDRVFDKAKIRKAQTNEPRKMQS
jgi:short-subunit dehydrogenase